MSDGAHRGVSAQRAIDTILGGEPSPTEDEAMTDEQFEQYVRGQADPDELEAGNLVPEWDYGDAAAAIAKAMLVLVEEDPSLLNLTEYYPDDCEVESLRGTPRDWSSVMYERIKARWPQASRRHYSGMTGFMWGWAANAVRKIMGAGPVPNPAIITVSTKEE